MTRSAMLTSGNCRQDGDHVSWSEGRIQAFAVAHVVRVDKEIDVPAYGAGFIADTAVQRRVPPLELFEHCPNACSRERQFRAPAQARRASGSWTII